MMSAEPIRWSQEKQKGLQEQLVGMWAEDSWELRGKRGTNQKRYAHFSLLSSSLKTELKYAFWYKFDSGAWKAEKAHARLASDLKVLVAWLNHAAPHAQSLLEKPLAYWEWSLRSYLVETNQLRQLRDWMLTTQQEYVERLAEDYRIRLLRQCYKILVDAYGLSVRF
jgi:hypothetical protein